MSILADLFRPKAILPTGPITTSGQLAEELEYRDAEDGAFALSAKAALQVADVYAAVRVLAETIAQLPAITYERQGEDSERATKHWLYPLLHDQPNAWQTAFEWKEMMQSHLALEGNAYSLITRNNRGEVLELLPIPPNRVDVQFDVLYRLVYFITMPNGDRKPFKASEVLHFRGLNYDGGPKGLSVIGYQRETLGYANLVSRYGHQMYKNGAKMGGILQIPDAIGETERKQIEADFQKKTSDLKEWGKTIILEEGVKFIANGMSAKDAEFIAAMKYGKRQIATIFKIPPHLIGDLENATFTNIEQQHSEFLLHSIGPWLERWEQRLMLSLLPPAERKTIYVEFLVDQLLRGDSQSRMEFYKGLIPIGVMSPNEARRRENMNRRKDPGGDKYVEPAFLTGKQPANQPEESVA